MLIQWYRNRQAIKQAAKDKKANDNLIRKKDTVVQSLYNTYKDLSGINFTYSNPSGDKRSHMSIEQIKYLVKAEYNKVCAEHFEPITELALAHVPKVGEYWSYINPNGTATDSDGWTVRYHIDEVLPCGGVVFQSRYNTSTVRYVREELERRIRDLHFMPTELGSYYEYGKGFRGADL